MHLYVCVCLCVLPILYQDIILPPYKNQSCLSQLIPIDYLHFAPLHSSDVNYRLDWLILEFLTACN